ncbi:hypothetical protein J7643_07620 [bacterium]|nr:hypothetical protein [bacterium]
MFHWLASGTNIALAINYMTRYSCFSNFLIITGRLELFETVGRIGFAALVVFGYFASPQCAEAKNEKLGEEIYTMLVKKYPSIQQPDVRGLATSTPRVTLYVPFKVWAKLSKAEKQSVQAYMPTLVAKVKASPDSYVGIPSSAPVYGRFRAKIPTLSSNAWEIMGGNIIRSSKGGNTITVDRTLACGDGDCN